MSTVSKPAPRGDGLNGEFYAHCGKGELRFQRCVACGTWRHMPRYTCAACGSAGWTWERSSGRGRLYSFTITHRAFHPSFNDDVPYAIAVIEMEEGVRMVSQVIDTPSNQLSLDMPLEVTFRFGTGGALPYFQARKDALLGGI